MKRSIAVAALLCLLGSVAFADYVDPPGWENDPYFTHQSWSFGRSFPAGVPQVADAGYVSPGVPLGTRMAGTWLNDLGMGHEGGWQFTGGVAGLLGNFYIPNVPNPDLLKQIWMQATIKTNVVDPAALMLGFAVFDDQGVPFTPVAYDWDLLGVDPTDGGTWARVTGVMGTSPQPAWETVVVSNALAPNQYLIVDQFDVDTHCIVPEPASFTLLLGVGLLGLIGYLRRK